MLEKDQPTSILRPVNDILERKNMPNDNTASIKENNAAAVKGDFSKFGLPEKLLQNLNRMQFTSPTPIQSEAIPFAMAGRDILGSAQTGTGKTGAFGIPLIAKLMEDEFATALVMTPTRELASQVLAALQQMIPVQNIKAALLIGGDAMPKQFRQLQMKPRLIVGTPGRINDHLERGTLKLNKTKFLVLDETDRMLDMGFGIQIDTILKHVPENGRQTMLFSATLPAGIVKISSKYLNNPQRISVGSTTTPAAKIKQEQVNTSESDKYQQLLVQLGNRTGSVIIFVKTKFGADRLADRLARAEHPATAIHGDLKQSRRERVIQDFRNKKHRILVATDVAARGLDIPHIEHVINYDLPQCPEDYIHRIGRTARAGAEGEACNLLTPGDNAKWRAIQRLINPGESMPAHKDEGRGQGREGGRGGRSNGGGKGRSFGDKSSASKPWQKKPFFKDNARTDGQAARQDRPFSGGRSEGARSSEGRPERKQWDPAPQTAERSERPAFKDAGKPQGERKSWGEKPAWKKDSKPAGERKSWGDRPSTSNGGERKAWGDKPATSGGERKPWVKQGDRNSSAPRSGEGRPAFGNRDGKPAGERKSWGEKPAWKKDSKPMGERKAWGDKPGASAGDAPKKKHYGNRMKSRPAA
jgi:ATP-dependent RNA helicase DeaD